MVLGHAWTQPSDVSWVSPLTSHARPPRAPRRALSMDRSAEVIHNRRAWFASGLRLGYGRVAEPHLAPFRYLDRFAHPG